MVPSSLVGHQLAVRLHHDRVEVLDAVIKFGAHGVARLERQLIQNRIDLVREVSQAGRVLGQALGIDHA